jgi:hypothetical protein
MTEIKIDKDKLKDSRGNYLTQGLFLEDRYDAEMSVFTFSGEHKTYNGKFFPSLKQLYLEHSDPIEYSFAKKYLYDWGHWKRLCANAKIRRHIDEWRKELELYLISEGVNALIDLALNDKSYQAAKYLADRGWDKNERGRPSKSEIEGELKRRADEEQEYSDDFRLLVLPSKKGE